MPITATRKKKMQSILRSMRAAPSYARPHKRDIPSSRELFAILEMFDAIRNAALPQYGIGVATKIAAAKTRDRYGGKFATASAISRRSKVRGATTWPRE